MKVPRVLLPALLLVPLLLSGCNKLQLPSRAGGGGGEQTQAPAGILIEDPTYITTVFDKAKLLAGGPICQFPDLTTDQIGLYELPDGTLQFANPVKGKCTTPEGKTINITLLGLDPVDNLLSQ